MRYIVNLYKYNIFVPKPLTSRVPYSKCTSNNVFNFCAYFTVQTISFCQDQKIKFDGFMQKPEAFTEKLQYQTKLSDENQGYTSTLKKSIPQGSISATVYIVD